MDVAVFKVDGMHCGGCAERIRKLLGKEPGVRAVRVSFTAGSAEVRHNPHAVDEARLRAVIETGGFNVREPTT
ncbi:MAG: heavy metal-associated domain-containing protein [Alphaproteobacteria bacterium]